MTKNFPGCFIDTCIFIPHLFLQVGIDIVCNALRMPCMTIARNAGVDAAMVVAKVLNGSDDYGYDAMRDEFGMLIDKGIIDPTKVVRTAIQDAAGVASLLSTTEVVITEQRGKDPLSALADGGGAGALEEALGGMDLGGMGGMDALAALGGMGGMGGMGDMAGMEDLGGMGMDTGSSAKDMNEAVKSIPGMEDVEVHDIDSSLY